MGSIRDILGLPPEINKPDLKKVEDEKTSRKSENKTPVKDKLEISSAGRELLSLKTEAANAEHVSEVRRSETLSDKDIELIQERIEANFYNDPRVIDKILDELMELPHFTEAKDIPFENK